MYEKHEPSALFHGLHHAHKRRVAEEQALRGVGDLGAPMLLLSLFYAETAGEQWSQRDVARTLRLSPATVAVSLKTLERDGYINRTADERDQRRNRVTLTDKGRSTEVRHTVHKDQQRRRDQGGGHQGHDDGKDLPHRAAP